MSLNKNLLRIAVAGAAFVLPGFAAMAEEITWWTPNWGAERAQKLIKDFEAANPDITIKTEITVSNGLQNRIQVVLQSGAPPDLIETSMQWVAPFAQGGKLLPLDKFAASNVDLKDLLPATVEASTYDGKLYALPYRAQTLGLIYNKQLYRDAGLNPDQPPQTWDEFIAASKKLTRTNAKGEQQYGIGVAGGGEISNLITRMVPFMWMNGGDVFSPAGKTALVNQPAAVAAVKFYTDPLTTLNIAPPSTLQNDGLALRRLFDQGTVAQYFSGQYDLPAIKKEAPGLDIGVAPFPHPEGKQTAGILSGWTFVVPAASKHIDATLKFLAFLEKPENQGFFTDTFPASQSAMSLPRFADPLLQPFKAMLEFAKPVPTNPAWIQAQQILFDNTQQVLLKSASPQDAMNTAAQQIQDILDQQ